MTQSDQEELFFITEEIAAEIADQERERRLVRSLTPSERAALRRDMAEASAWMRAELKRRKST
jgi:hypothetical protein